MLESKTQRKRESSDSTSFLIPAEIMHKLPIYAEIIVYTKYYFNIYLILLLIFFLIAFFVPPA